MKKIGILCPSDTELRPFLPHIKAAKITEKAMLKIYDGMIESSLSRNQELLMPAMLMRFRFCQSER